MGTRRRLIAGGIAAAAVAATALTPAPVQASGSVARPLVTEFDGQPLSSPKGIAIAADGAVIIAQGAFGPPGPVLRYDPSAPRRDRLSAITDPFNLVDVAISPLDGTGWAISEGVLFHQLADGTIVEVLDIVAYQLTDPDPVDQEGIPEESNAYGLTVAPNGDALVADAAGNDIIRVTPAGAATTLARFDIETVSTDHLGPEFGPLPPTIDAEAVPTSVTVGPDGAIYVGELKGFPFRPGTSHVWRIDPAATGATCSVNTPSADCTVYLDGLTAIQDIAFNNANNRLYVLQLARDGVLAFEEGFVTGVFPPGMLLEFSRIGRWNERVLELGMDQIFEPGGVAIGHDGKIYVTDGVFSEGRLLRVTR